ncbi:unnamed protein product [Rotaria sordida]|uniref:Uncharacterized protein n=1 Tax=Rotaria sordida TaxID=392033 RepID=A0A814LLG3_9BILA|nr:unnamed protein product [Rotaria sordida]CAF0963107.1 unnamed protein product [Rotaria sordida]CAF1066782.1 unnamed protein product [Rotaria sordida]CAF3616255.1 unnamed protein product [Rotaria sordida]CAF3627417.1 unnamed protein product [Rotaria sordida]
MYISTTNGYGLCSCSCCLGIDCTPIDRGTVEISSCDELNCYNACEIKFPFACKSSGPGTISASCEEIFTTAVTTSSSSTENTTITVTTTMAPTTTTVTVSTTSSPQTSPTSTTTITSILSTTTTTSKSDSGAFILRENPSFIALTVISILIIIKVML